MEHHQDLAPRQGTGARRVHRLVLQIIKQDVMAAVGAVHGGDSRRLHLLNSAFMVLIPKKEDAVEVKDFRPISLVHSFAKLVTKIMANRLASILKSMVAPNQSAFIRGRSIHDNFMMVQQTTRCLHRKGKPTLLLKLDITKAFDSVSWAFLLEVLIDWDLTQGGGGSCAICYHLHQQESSSMVTLVSLYGIYEGYVKGTLSLPCFSSW